VTLLLKSYARLDLKNVKSAANEINRFSRILMTTSPVKLLTSDISVLVLDSRLGYPEKGHISMKNTARNISPGQKYIFTGQQMSVGRHPGHLVNSTGTRARITDFL